MSSLRWTVSRWSSSRPCEEALARTRELGLFPERLDASPYAFEAAEEGQDIQRPGTDRPDIQGPTLPYCTLCMRVEGFGKGVGGVNWRGCQMSW